jgi:hypothetical protein
MKDLENYLRRATKGVYGVKKLEIIAELRGSIEDRIWKLENQGFSQTQALEKVLLEFGAAKVVNAGLMKEHTMPKILKSTVLAIIFAAVSLTALTNSHAQIEVVTSPLGGSVSAPDLQIAQSYNLSFSSIKANLEAQGITVDDTPIAPQGKILGVAWKIDTLPSLRFQFPGARKPSLLQSIPGYDSPWKNDAGKLIQNVQPKGNLSNDRVFIGLFPFLQQLRQSELPVRIEGWQNPTIRVGQTAMKISSKTILVTPWQLYSSIAGRAAIKGFPKLQGWGNTSNAKRHSVRVNSSVGTVYAVVTPLIPLAPDYLKNMQHIDIARVDANGILYFRAPHNVIEFTQSREAVYADRLNISKKGYGSSKRPAKALLMRMNPDLSVTLELPAKTRSATIKSK